MYNNETDAFDPKDGRNAQTDETPTMGTDTVANTALSYDETNHDSEVVNSDEEDFMEDDENLDYDEDEDEDDETGSGL